MRVFRQGKAEPTGGRFGGTIGSMTAHLDEALVGTMPPAVLEWFTTFGQELGEQMAGKRTPDDRGNPQPYGERLLGVHLLGIDFTLILGPRE